MGQGTRSGQLTTGSRSPLAYCANITSRVFTFSLLALPAVPKALDHHILHGLETGSEVLTRIEFGFVVRQKFADRCGRCEAQVRIDVHFSHTVADAFLNFFQRHAIGFRNFATA